MHTTYNTVACERIKHLPHVLRTVRQSDGQMNLRSISFVNVTIAPGWLGSRSAEAPGSYEQGTLPEEEPRARAQANTIRGRCCSSALMITGSRSEGQARHPRSETLRQANVPR
ncbi:unnamed protein product [Mycena citricolor]|uniref:Uncharacterized protein n=1 Tax=Mycena citricolor TaxID=2018698 RepID=A0AAD2HC10_9AGAR|nr:unnamed protein product [Mycena citricolor]